MERAVKDAVVELRNVSRGLSLPAIDRQSLAEIVQSAADAHAARTGTDVRVEEKADASHDTPSAAKNLRVPGGAGRADERLAPCGRRGAGGGADRHAGSDHHFGPRQRPRLSCLGQGKGRGEGLGLPGLADRIESLGGRIECLNRPEGGAEMRVTLVL